MKLFDVNAVLDGVKPSLVVGETVDLTHVRLRGRRIIPELVSISGEAAVREGVVTLNCTWRYNLSMVCDRCLKPFEREVTQHSSHIVVREISGPDRGEFVVSPSGKVDLTDLGVNDIVPELPARMLCREDCQGICPVCGQNRNEADCGCSTQQKTSPFDGLSKFFEE